MYIVHVQDKIEWVGVEFVADLARSTIRYNLIGIPK